MSKKNKFPLSPRSIQLLKSRKKSDPPKTTMQTFASSSQSCYDLRRHKGEISPRGVPPEFAQIHRKKKSDLHDKALASLDDDWAKPPPSPPSDMETDNPIINHTIIRVHNELTISISSSCETEVIIDKYDNETSKITLLCNRPWNFTLNGDEIPY